MSQVSVVQWGDLLQVEVDRLRHCRPALEARIKRAEGIVLLQVACGRDHRPIRGRVTASGDVVFLVAGSGGSVYRVVPGSPSRKWSCTCPDHHRRGAACKHIVACYIWRRALARLTLRPRQVPTADERALIARVVETEEAGGCEYDEARLQLEAYREDRARRWREHLAEDLVCEAGNPERVA